MVGDEKAQTTPSTEMRCSPLPDADPTNNVPVSLSTAMESGCLTVANLPTSTGIPVSNVYPTTWLSPGVLTQTTFVTSS